MDKHFFGLWYKKPANAWVEALPVGNGRLGGMIYGGLQHETISLNEETVWDGGRIERNNPNAFIKLNEIREAIFSGQYEQAENIGREMLGKPNRLDSYQPLCDLDMRIVVDNTFKNYSRGLDIENAVHTSRYLMGSDEKSWYWYTRDTFVSAPDDIMVVHFCTEAEKGISTDISFSRMSRINIKTGNSEIALSGCCREGGINFSALVQVFVDRGEILHTDNSLQIRGAKSIELRITGATNYSGGHALEKCRAILTSASGKSYQELRQRHIEDYRSLYTRQRFSLGGNPSLQSTDELIKEYGAGNRNMTIYELWYNYLRYQLISSSRQPGIMPSTLQGIWNDKMKAPWNSDFHPNVNMQINYWPAEGYRLPECVQPLIEWIKFIMPYGEKTAKIHYNARGWVLHHISDIYGCTTPMDGLWGLWPFGGAWLCRHLYERYLYGRSKEYLKDILPIVEGSAIFMVDFLVECPKGLAGEGYLVTNPSHSPENKFIINDGKVSWLTYAAAMDIEIIYDIFTIYLDCLNILGIDSEYKTEVEDAKNRLAPLKISDKTGCLMEWIEDYEESDKGHRHVSHLYALYPGTQINSQTPEFMHACEAALERRLAHNYKAQGWSCGWIASLFARLGRGEMSLQMLDLITGKLVFDNLFVNAHGSPQVGDAQGVAASIQEMLIQSHDKKIVLLPALPAEWKNGVMEGIPVRGGHIVDLYWLDGKLVKANIKATNDSEISICSTLKKVVGIDSVTDRADDSISFPVKAGVVYVLI